MKKKGQIRKSPTSPRFLFHASTDAFLATQGLGQGLEGERVSCWPNRGIVASSPLPSSLTRVSCLMSYTATCHLVTPQQSPAGSPEGVSVTKDQDTSPWAVAGISDRQTTFPKPMHCVLQKMPSSSLLTTRGL